jgi:hypothetical protein
MWENSGCGQKSAVRRGLIFLRVGRLQAQPVHGPQALRPQALRQPPGKALSRQYSANRALAERQRI